MTEINASRLSAASVFRFGYYAFLSLVLPVMTLFGLVGFGGTKAVTLNGEYVYGIKALATAVAMGLLFPAFLALWLVLGSLILRLLRDRAPVLRSRR